MKNIGTGSDPTNSAYKADWDAAADIWNELGRQAKARGMRLYTHNHDAAYSFLLDTGPAGRARPADPLVRASAGWSTSSARPTRGTSSSSWTSTGPTWPGTSTRSTSTRPAQEQTDLFDPILTVADRDRPGSRSSTPRTATGTPAVPNGYEMIPLGEGDINFQQFFQTIGERDFHHANWEHGHRPRRRREPGPVAGLRGDSATTTCPS